MEMILPEISLKFLSLHNGLELILLDGETGFHWDWNFMDAHIVNINTIFHKFWVIKIILNLILASDSLYFNGTSLVRWNLRDSPVSAHRESIRFRFKTNVADGVLLYGIGSQGDYLALQLKDNRLLLNINLGIFGYYLEKCKC